MAAALRVLGFVASMAATAHATQVVAARKAASMIRGGGFVRSFEFKQRLRICNAYPHDASLDIYHDGKSLTGDVPMSYKQCRDFGTPLREGDKLDFKNADSMVGTFAISELPSSDAILLLIIYQHDAQTTAASFKSHVFAATSSAQVAVVDVHKGKTQAIAKIVDSAPSGNGTISEELRFDSVVAVNPGRFDIRLESKDGKVLATRELVVVNRESYTIIRTGLESEEGHSYPDDLIIFPRTPPSALKSHAEGRFVGMAAMAASILACAVALA
mmetsp:Transcript_92036/g.265608  ORF Transcript_92036/g.265608 Transcript_92036/m.265608 type:complete len:272 (-) Transcript_92036:119-934(-)